jgi:hypothetical protein
MALPQLGTWTNDLEYCSRSSGCNLPTTADVLPDIGLSVSLVELIGLERELSQLLDRRVDVVPARSLKPAVARRVLAEAVPL